MIRIQNTKLAHFLLILGLAGIAGAFYIFFAIKNITPAKEMPPQQPPSSLIKRGAGEYDLLALDYAFSPEEFTVPKGKPVKIFVDNTGEHTFTVDELGINVPLSKRFEMIEFTPTKSGTFKFYSSIPGQKEQGMFGTLKVE